MKLKKDEQGHVIVVDDKPVYLDDNDKDVVFDVPAAIAKISSLNSEAKGHRIAKEAAETKLKEFEGIDDPEAARKALTTVKNLDDKKLIDAGKVEQIKNEAIAAVEAKYKPIVEERDKVLNNWHGEKISNEFAKSKFISEKTAVARSLLEPKFRPFFKIEEGKLVARGNDGNQIFSKGRPGELADFDEAMSILVDSDPDRDHILKAPAGNGSGSRGSSNGVGKEDMSKMSPVARMNISRGVTT